ncbi:MAG: S-layer protein [Sporomusaceae bacterium]|nr:S-layer protein [Sporomusaceae bacterium]
MKKVFLALLFALAAATAMLTVYRTEQQPQQAAGEIIFDINKYRNPPAAVNQPEAPATPAGRPGSVKPVPDALPPPAAGLTEENAISPAPQPEPPATVLSPAVPVPAAGLISQQQYADLLDELQNVSRLGLQADRKINIAGELRYHYALNDGGTAAWNRDNSGLRLYLGADSELMKNWRLYSRLEAKQSIRNYNTTIDFSRLYITGKIGTSRLQAGSFGYLMAEGNIYDSGFDGIRLDFGDRARYTLSYGKTGLTDNMALATAHYESFDYNLTTGLYHYRERQNDDRSNTLWMLGGNYKFENGSIGAMLLQSSQADSRGNDSGYVLTLRYGDLKAWRPGTYQAFAKYYDQPRHTYISHDMNGMGSKMDGFKGYGLGISYTPAENLVAGLEYYSLSEKSSDRQNKTLWAQLSYYF